MVRLIAWAGAATLVEVTTLALVVHALLRHAMRARGLPSWRLADTLLTSPLLWIGAALLAGALNRGVAAAALDVGRGTAEGAAWTTVGAALAGLAMAWFGVRAVGKLY